MITKPLSPADSAIRRPVCASCFRPVRTCICCWSRPMATDVEVVILQHPLEERHPKGSARLLHLSLPRSRLAIGECFDDRELHALLYQPIDTPAPAGDSPARQPVLLYPTTDDMVANAILDPALLNPAGVRLIVLDGTWRKSRRMLHAHPVLQDLPRLALESLPPSRYRIRHAYRPDQLSTLEAVCHALGRIDDDALKYQPLLSAFDGFIEAQQSWLAGKGGMQRVSST